MPRELPLGKLPPWQSSRTTHRFEASQESRARANRSVMSFDSHVRERPTSWGSNMMGARTMRSGRMVHALCLPRAACSSNSWATCEVLSPPPSIPAISSVRSSRSNDAASE